MISVANIITLYVTYIQYQSQNWTFICWLLSIINLIFKFCIQCSKATLSYYKILAIFFVLYIFESNLFYWRIIALQYCGGLSCTSIWISHNYIYQSSLCFPGDLDSKEFVCNAENLGLIPGLGRSPGEGNGNLLQYFWLENPMVRGAWQATVHGVAKRQTGLNS